MEIIGLILGIIFGTLIGASLIEIDVKQTKEVNNILRATINELEKELDGAKDKISYRDNFIKDYQKEHEILLNNASKLRAKIVDLENNIELLTNNLSNKNKELISDDQSEN